MVKETEEVGRVESQSVSEPLSIATSRCNFRGVITQIGRKFTLNPLRKIALKAKISFPPILRPAWNVPNLKLLVVTDGNTIKVLHHQHRLVTISKIMCQWRLNIYLGSTGERLFPPLSLRFAIIVSIACLPSSL